MAAAAHDENGGPPWDKLWRQRVERGHRYAATETDRQYKLAEKPTENQDRQPADRGTGNPALAEAGRLEAEYQS